MTTTTTRKSYSFKEGLTMMAAKDLGIDPYLAADAGEGAKAALNHLRKAGQAKNQTARASHIKDAQGELKSISAAKHPKLVNAIQAKLLALQGRGGDTEIAHVTPGEVVIPRSMQTPELMQQIAALAAQRGINPAQLSVGHSANNINPKTGQPEFIETFTFSYPPAPPVRIPRVQPITQATVRSPFGRHAYVGGEDMYFSDRLLRETEGLSEEELKQRFGVQEPKIQFNEIDTTVLDSALRDKNREYFEKLKIELQSTLISLGRVQTGFTIGGGLLLVFLLPAGVPVVALTGLTFLSAEGMMTYFGWKIEDAIERIDAGLARLQ